MKVPLSFEQRAAIQWLGGWYARERLRVADWALSMRVVDGLDVLASLAPPAIMHRATPPVRGRPRGVRSIAIGSTSAPSRLHAPLSALAAVLGYARPQEVVAAVADEILKRAPGVALGCGGAEAFAAVGALVSEIEAAIQAALHETAGEAQPSA